MNEEREARVDRLVALLQSGEFKNGYGGLRKLETPEEYCCLGVACELYRRETGNGRWEEHPNVDEQNYYFTPEDAEDTNSIELPEHVRDYFGFQDIIGSYISQKPVLSSRNNLIYLNDDAKVGLKAIGDLIATRPNGMFIEE